MRLRPRLLAPTPHGKRAIVKNACRELALVLDDGATLRARVFQYRVDFAARNGLEHVDVDWFWADGRNADRVGTDYMRTTSQATAAAPLRLDLAPGGGAVVRLRRK